MNLYLRTLASWLIWTWIFSAPAFADGKTDLTKQPPCAAGSPVVMVLPEPDLIVINFLMAQAHTRAWVKAEKAKRMAVPCKMAGRIRSPIDGQCWLKSRIPRS